MHRIPLQSARREAQRLVTPGESALGLPGCRCYPPPALTTCPIWPCAAGQPAPGTERHQASHFRRIFTMPRAAPPHRANATRALAMAAVEQAKPAHPGLRRGTADIATVLFTQFLKFDAAD